MKLTQDIQHRPITDIRPYGRNPRKNEKSIKMLKQAIKEFGFLVPITVDPQGTIVTGHSRYFAARELGLTELPVIVLDLPKDKIAEFRIADNAAADHTKFDQMQLDGVLQGFSAEEMAGYFDIQPIGSIEPIFSPEPAEEDSDQPVKPTAVYTVREEPPEDVQEEAEDVGTVHDLICPHCLHEFQIERD